MWVAIQAERDSDALLRGGSLFAGIISPCKPALFGCPFLTSTPYSLGHNQRPISTIICSIASMSPWGPCLLLSSAFEVFWDLYKCQGRAHPSRNVSESSRTKTEPSSQPLTHALCPVPRAHSYIALFSCFSSNFSELCFPPCRKNCPDVSYSRPGPVRPTYASTTS